MLPMSYELLRPQDATLLYAQDPAAPLQIGALALFEAAPLRDQDGTVRMDDIRAHVETRSGAVARSRQRLVTTGFGLGPAVWVDDPDFDIADHVRLAALPRPGDRACLRDLMGGLMEAPLDPNRPLWEIWVVEGVEGDRIAVIPKVSHVMADGMALLDFVLRVLDVEPAPPPATPAAPAGAPAPSPGDLPLLAGATIGRARRQLATTVGALGRLRPGRPLVAAGAALARSAVGARPAPRSPLNRPVGRRRDMTWLSQPMAGLQEVARAQAVSLNDVVLAAVAGALRDVVAGEGEPDGRIRPRALVPVSTHGPTSTTEVDNRFSLLLADLPVSMADPVERLQHVHADMTRRKRSAETSIGSVLLAVSDLVPAWLIRLLAPTLLGHQPVVNLAVTNLPGTDRPLYLLGSRLCEAYPYVTVIGNIALIVGVLSYGGSLGVGLTVDPDVVQDVDGLAEALERSFAELVAAGRGGRGRRGARRRGPRSPGTSHR